MLENIKTIFFDYDGTIHNSIYIYAPAFRKAYEYLVSENQVPQKEWSNDEIQKWLGYTSVEMWKLFLPKVDSKYTNNASKIVGQEMMHQIEIGNGKLYDGSIEVLQKLKEKNYKLVFLSNCNTYYKEIHNKVFNLDNYFDELVGAEEYNFISKSEILSKIKNNYKEKMVIIGDRIHDIEAGKNNGIYTIGCGYGFGEKEEIKEADYIIREIKEVLEIL